MCQILSQLPEFCRRYYRKHFGLFFFRTRCIYFVGLYYSKVSKVTGIYKRFIMMHHLKVLRYDPCVTRGSHSFTCHPHTNHTCLYSQPQGITALRLVPTYTAWLQRHIGVRNLPRVFTPRARPRLERTTSWSQVQHSTDSATTPLQLQQAYIFNHCYSHSQLKEHLTVERWPINRKHKATMTIEAFSGVGG